MGKTLAVAMGSLTFDNPFVLGSGPPGTNANVICKAFAAGWGGVVAKTTCLSDSHVVNVVPRYGKMRSPSGDVVGFENIELISDRPFEHWEDDFKRVKKEYPHKMLIASIMERYEKPRWQEVARRCAQAGVDALELNFSCPHGHPEQGMGAAMGICHKRVGEVTSWVTEAVPLPVWAKMTPNITHIDEPARAAWESGAQGISAINTILSIIGIDLATLRPLPTVEGYSVPGGYSAQAIKPIGLKHVRDIAVALPEATISGMGGVCNAHDAIEYLLLGARTVQVCTGAMLQGVQLIDVLTAGLHKFMVDHKFSRVDEIVGKSLPYFTTHHDLVERQAAKKAVKKAARAGHDTVWADGDLQTTTARMTSNE